ncbi:MAG: hypothetical protein M1826_004862 [Phylliscum demangeonii]|nr:MAG: hypothetical protein M1826_004862 [Phylliscum demangeonii]
MELQLSIYWAYECHKWRKSMQTLGKEFEWPAGVLPHARLTEAEHDVAGRAARLLAERLLKSAKMFNGARTRFRDLIHKDIESYQRSGVTGPFRYPDDVMTSAEDDIPPPAPERIYYDVFRYLNQWRDRRMRLATVAPVAPPPPVEFW